MAVGGEYRYENYLTYAGDAASYMGSGADGANGLRPSEESDLDRNVFGTYAELSGDLTDRFFVDAATRWAKVTAQQPDVVRTVSRTPPATSAMAAR